jgi:predicted alpha/beta-hydrolase family hydrolase
VETLDVETSVGIARVHVEAADSAAGALVLGHGAGGGISAPDLTTAARTARDEGFTVALAEQPYRVAGRRAPAPAAQLDRAWTDVCRWLRAERVGDLPLVVAGRSSGARVACRTSAEVGAVGVLCLAFPLRPPGRPDAPSRLPELEAVSVPVLVVQGENDPFGIPPPDGRREVAVVRGDHSLRSDSAAVGDAARRWLRMLLRLL